MTDTAKLTHKLPLLQVLQSEAPSLHIGKFVADGSCLVSLFPVAGPGVGAAAVVVVLMGSWER